MFLTLDSRYRCFNQSDEYFEIYEMPEVEEAKAQFCEYESRLDRSEYLAFEDVALNIHSSSEMQGWVYGYMFAMRMLGECGVKVGGSV